MSTTAWPFIEVDHSGRASITAKKMPVLQLVREHLTFVWDAEQLHRQHPHLTLSEIYSALGYYYEHLDECAAQLESDERRLASLKQELTNPELQQRLRLARDKA